MKTFYFIKATVCLLLIGFLFSCSKGGSNPTPTPPVATTPPVTTTPPTQTTTITITSLSVTSGVYNASVTITGTGFNSAITNNQVLFNGKAAILTAATATQVTARVPLAAGTGNVDVSVNGGTLVIGPIFTYQLSEVPKVFAGSYMTGFQNGTGTSALFNGLESIAVDAAGNIYAADAINNLIRKITPNAEVTTLAGSGSEGYANGPNLQATFGQPLGVAVDAKGNVYVADGFLNDLIRKVVTDGNVSTVAGDHVGGFVNGNGLAARFFAPFGVAVDASGNLYIADASNNVIRKITPDNTVSTFAGSGTHASTDGMGLAAAFSYPMGLTIDKAGNLYVTESGDNKIRKITPAGLVSTIAGTGAKGSANGAANVATFNNPYGIAIDAAGNLFVCDSYNTEIRKITPDGVVSTFAGNVISPGSGATLTNPNGIAIDSKGNIYVSDGNEIDLITLQ